MCAIIPLISLEKRGTLITYEIRRRQILFKNCLPIFEVWLCFLKVHCIPLWSSLIAMQSQKNNSAYLLSCFSLTMLCCFSSPHVSKILIELDNQLYKYLTQ